MPVAVAAVKKREPKQSRSPTNRLSSSELDWVDTSEDEDKTKLREVGCRQGKQSNQSHSYVTSALISKDGKDATKEDFLFFLFKCPINC